MKRKSIKIILGVIIFIILIGITLTILIVNGIIPNPFLDTSDLVCVRKTIFEHHADQEEYIFSFDSKAIIKSYKIVSSSIYDTKEEAKEYYDENKQYVDSLVLIEEENKVQFEFEGDVSKSKELKSKAKPEIKQLYIEKYMYECN